METKSMIFIIYFHYVLGYNSYFSNILTVLNIPDKGIVRQADAWFSALFNKTLFQFFISGFCPDFGDKNINEENELCSCLFFFLTVKSLVKKDTEDGYFC